MFTELFNLVKDNSQLSIRSNELVPNDKKGATTAEAAITLVNYFRNQHTALPVFTPAESLSQDIVLQINERLISRIGLTPAAASSVSSALVPVLMEQLQKQNWINVESAIASLPVILSPGSDLTQ